MACPLSALLVPGTPSTRGRAEHSVARVGLAVRLAIALPRDDTKLVWRENVGTSTEIVNLFYAELFGGSTTSTTEKRWEGGGVVEPVEVVQSGVGGVWRQLFSFFFTGSRNGTLGFNFSWDGKLRCKTLAGRVGIFEKSHLTGRPSRIIPRNRYGPSS